MNRVMRTLDGGSGHPLEKGFLNRGNAKWLLRSASVPESRNDSGEKNCRKRKARTRHEVTFTK